MVGINFARNGLNELRPKLHPSSTLAFIQKLMIFESKEKKVFDAFSVSGFREGLGGERGRKTVGQVKISKKSHISNF